MKSKQEPIRIAQIVGKWLGGGVEAVVMNYYRNIDRSKIQFDFICDDDSTNIPYEEIESLGGKVILIPPYQKVFKYHKELKKVLKEGNYKIVHSHINTLSVFSLCAAWAAKVPVRIAHSHSTTNKKEWKKNILKNIFRPFVKFFATNYMACTDHAARWMFGNRKVDNGEVFVLNNAIELEKYKYNALSRKKIRDEFNIKDTTTVIGHVGRFVEQKNHRFLISVFNEYLKINNDSILMLIGQGPLIDEIKKMVKNFDIEGNVLFVGQKENVYEYYNAMDVFLFPSLYEGLGMVVVEAQTNGLPCVVSTEVPNVVDVSNCVSFVDLNSNISDWQSALCDNLNCNSDRTKNYNKLISSNFNIKNETDKLINKYLNYCGKYINILQIGMTDNHGGIEEFIYSFTSNINSEKIKFDFINMSNNKIVYEENISKYGNIYKVCNEFKHPIKCYFSLKKIMEDNKYSVVHINKNSVSSLITLYAAKKANIPIRILHSHNTKSNGGFLVNCLHAINKNMVSKLCTHFLACSHDAARWMFPNRIVLNNKYQIINNAINIDKFMFDPKIRDRKRIELNLNENDYVIGHVGRFVEQNHRFLLDVFNNYYKKNNNAKLVLVGVGPLMPEIVKFVKDNDIEKNVIFLNNRKDVNELYQAFDLFMFPSLYEGLGIVLIEAQATGLPCIASNALPKNSKITDLVEFVSLDNLDEWICRCGIINADRRKQFEIVKKSDYNLKKELNKLEKIYLKVLK